MSDALQGRVAGENGQRLLSMVPKAPQLQGLTVLEALPRARGALCQPHAAQQLALKPSVAGRHPGCSAPHPV